MSSPAIKRQSRVRVGYREIGKIKEEIEMRLTTPITEVKNWVSREAGTIITANAIRGLAVGVLLMAGTGMYFGMTASSEGSNPVSSEGTKAFPAQDQHEQMAAGLEADIESYRSFLTDYVDEEGNPAPSK